jgi:hypothetical protein
VASGTIAGAIVDNAGKPAAVQVDLFDAHGDCSRELAHVTSDVSDGQFAFTGLPIWDGTAAHNSLYVIVLHKTPAQIARSTFGPPRIGCGSSSSGFAMFAIGTMSNRGGSGTIRLS